MAVVVAAIMLAPGLVLAKQVRGETTPTAWTYALFVNGDNDLEKYWEEYSLPALLNIPASSGVKIVAMMDRMSTQGTELIEISGGSWQVVNTYPEMNFGDGATFSWFITEINTRYPADNLAVCAWDHGYAWRYFSNDQTSGDRITMPEMQSAIQNAGVYIDILAFDCCNMASIEVIYQASLTNLVGLLVGSEETIPMNGFPYDLMLTPVANDPSRTPQQVAVDMVEGWAMYYDPLSWATTVNLAAIDVVMIGQSSGTLQTWCNLMYSDMGLYKKNYKNALSNCYIAWATYYHPDLADLGDALLADSGIKDAALRTATANMIALIDNAVLDVQSGSGAGDARGVTIWWGVRSDWKTYSVAYHDVAFAINMNWWAFLSLYNA
jgi:hypothetical protein